MTQDLKSLRNDLFRLHGALVRAERDNHERLNGPVQAGEMLRLLLEDQGFQWLRPLSGLVADIDGALADERRGEAMLDVSAARGFVDRARGVVEPGPEEAERYRSLVHETPDVLLAHRAVVGHLQRLDQGLAAPLAN
jgi:hypothetical protein